MLPESKEVAPPEPLATVAALLAREGIDKGFGALDAIGFVRSQPYHWLGLKAMMQWPVLWLLLLPMMLGLSWVTFDIHHFAFNGGWIPLSETRMVLLPWLLEKMSAVLPLSNKLVVGLLAAFPLFALGNVMMAVACGIVTRQRPSWRWLLAGGLGLVPLRYFADGFMPKWAFWGGTGIIGVNARILQFSVIYGLVCRKSRAELEELWLRLLDKRLRDVFDSLYSYVHIAATVVYGLGALLFYGIFPLLSATPPQADVILDVLLYPFHWLEPVFLLMCFFGWIALTRFLLGVTIFALLENPEFNAAPGSRWSRFLKMGGIVVGTTAILVGLIFKVSGQPVTDISLTPFSVRETTHFFDRIAAGPGVYDRHEHHFLLRLCVDQAGKAVGVYGAPYSKEGTQWDRVAVIDGDRLRYVPGATRAVFDDATCYLWTEADK